jgi:D-alanyl-D-alanine carboxypeptidase (penicillin-binding protein 5/6)
MKNTTPIKFSKARLLVNALSLLSIALFFVFSPVIGHVPGKRQPVVKATFVSEPAVPVGKNTPPPDLTAVGVFVADLNNGIVLYDKNPNLRLKPASLTKIMTALVSLDYYSEDAILSVKNGQNSLGATAKLLKGDKLNFKDMLYALLVPSGNDAAVTLAENYPGGYRAFLEKMNSKAVELGLNNTHFVNVSGVEGGNHYTSAYDIAMIARNALDRRLFTSTVSTMKITLKSLNDHYYPLETTNKLLGKPGIFGVKTGWTPEAGECLVTYVEKDGHPIIVSLLNSKDRFGESEKLINWIYANYLWQ